MTFAIPTRWDIGGIASLDIVGMPLLERHITAHPGALQDVLVLYVNHAISDSLMVARGLRRLGADLCTVLVPYHGATGQTQQMVCRGFRALGSSYQPSHAHPRDFSIVMRSAVRAAIAEVGRRAQRESRCWMIVEDGGYAFPLLHDDPELQPYLHRCFGAVEHTTRGRWNYEYCELDAVPRTARTLQRPAVTISGSALKTAHEAGFVAQALLDESHWLLRRDHQFLRHRVVAVVGYGRVGKALASAVTTVDADVIVVDPAAGQLEPGMRQGTLTDAITAGVFLVFGATGTSSFTRAALAAFVQQAPTRTLYLASASSKAVEFAEAIETLEQAAIDAELAALIAGSRATVTVEADADVGTRYWIHPAAGPAKQVVLLADGYPVIFYPPDTHGAPNRAMDPVMTQLFLAAAGLPDHPGLRPRVHDLDDLRASPRALLPPPWQALVDEQRMLVDWCDLNGIDWPTYRKAINFTAPAPTGPGQTAEEDR